MKIRASASVALRSIRRRKGISSGGSGGSFDGSEACEDENGDK